MKYGQQIDLAMWREERGVSQDPRGQESGKQKWCPRDQKELFSQNVWFIKASGKLREVKSTAVMES